MFKLRLKIKLNSSLIFKESLFLQDFFLLCVECWLF